MEILGARIVVDFGADFVDAGQRVQDVGVGAGVGHLLLVEDEPVFQADIVFLVEEAFALDAGHVEEVELVHVGFHLVDLLEGDAFLADHFFADVLGDTQFFGGDEDEADALVVAEEFDEGVHGAAELEVTAETVGFVLHVAAQPLDGENVGEGLRGVLVAAVAGVDQRHVDVVAGQTRGALFGMAHGRDVGVAFHGAQRVGDALALRGGRGRGLGETDDLSAQAQHGRLEAQARACARLIKKSCQDLAFATLTVLRRIGDDLVSQIENFAEFLAREIVRVDQTSVF